MASDADWNNTYWGARSSRIIQQPPPTLSDAWGLTEQQSLGERGRSQETATPFPAGYWDGTWIDHPASNSIDSHERENHTDQDPAPSAGKMYGTRSTTIQHSSALHKSSGLEIPPSRGYPQPRMNHPGCDATLASREKGKAWENGQTPPRKMAPHLTSIVCYPSNSLSTGDQPSTSNSSIWPAEATLGHTKSVLTGIEEYVSDQPTHRMVSKNVFSKSIKDSQTGICSTQAQQSEENPCSAAEQSRFLPLEEGIAFDYEMTNIIAWVSELKDSGILDTKTFEFSSGRYPVNNTKFGELVEQPVTEQDLASTENLNNQTSQTAEGSSRKYRHYVKKIHGQSLQATGFDPTPPPQPDRVTLRPADSDDLEAILDIYQYYVSNTNLIDFPVATMKGVEMLFQKCKGSDLPMIVATKAGINHHGDIDGAVVVGYGFATDYDLRPGHYTAKRSRYTVRANVFVDHKYLRQGIGSHLLDRLLQCLSSTYIGMGGYLWRANNSDTVYGSTQGSRRIVHQIILDRVFASSGDEEYRWIKAWLENRFGLLEMGRLPAVFVDGVDECSTALDHVFFQLSRK